jgi:hypothetical protein
MQKFGVTWFIRNPYTPSDIFQKIVKDRNNEIKIRLFTYHDWNSFRF